MKLFQILLSLPSILAASHYIISLNTDLNTTQTIEKDEPLASINSETMEILRKMNIEKEFKIGKKFHCKVTTLDDHSLTVLKQSTLIKDIFPDINVTISAVQNDAPDHLVRLSSTVPVNLIPSDELNYYYEETGKDVYAYILDTGVAYDHPEFEGRVAESVNFASDNSTFDLHGHGTHVAGIVGSKTFGVAKEVNIVNVRVLDSKGTGTLSSIIEGIEYAVNDRIKKNAKGVANLSLGSIYSGILNNAVDSAFETGLVMVVAAGNEGQDASRFSPASSAEAITVGAISDLTDLISDLTDLVTTFSNYGSIVDMFAPGSLVESLDVNNYDGSIRYSGTSMATPVVTGYTAILLEKGIKEIKDKLKEGSDLNSKALFPYGFIGRFIFRGTTTDIVYNEMGVESPQLEMNGLIDKEVELISWSAAKNGVDLYK